MATDEIAELFKNADAASEEPATNGDAPKEDINSLDSLKAKAAAKAAQGKAGSSSPAPAEASTPTAEATSTPPSDPPDSVKQSRSRKGKQTAAERIDSIRAQSDSNGSNGLTTQANDELAKLAAHNGETTSQASVPSDMPAGLTSGNAAPESYDQIRANLKAGREAGKKPKLTAAQKAKAERDKIKEREKAAKEKEKNKVKEKTEKQKEREAARKAAEKEKKDKRAAAEKERKDKLAAQKAERAKERASKATPDLLKKEPKAVQEMFAAHYKAALEEKVRRPKCDRGDFAAGWMTLLRAFKKEGKGQITFAPAASKS